MGMYGAGLANRLLLGGNSQDLIDDATWPILLIPFKKSPEILNRIAFASELSAGDIGFIQSLVSFARPFNAEILLIHICKAKADQHQLDKFLSEVTNKVNYPKIYYRFVDDKHTSRGLNWIAKNGVIDIFAMVHRKNAFLDNVFMGSETQNLSRKIQISILVFQENPYPVFCIITTIIPRIKRKSRS